MRDSNLLPTRVQLSASNLPVRYVSSLTDILRATLKRMERDPQFVASDRHARELRRRLLITIADAEARQLGEDGGSPPDRSPGQTASWRKRNMAPPRPGDATAQ